MHWVCTRRMPRVQGNRLTGSREIRIASLFRDAPAEFLQMIAVHELAHLKEREHDKAFYRLCCHMAPDYHQLEFDVRLYLTHLDLTGERLWASDTAQGATG
jgi:predicted metal-dependent hydrolase